MGVGGGAETCTESYDVVVAAVEYFHQLSKTQIHQSIKIPSDRQRAGNTARGTNQVHTITQSQHELTINSLQKFWEKEIFKESIKKSGRIIIIKNEKIRVTLCENAAGALNIVNKMCIDGQRKVQGWNKLMIMSIVTRAEEECL